MNTRTIMTSRSLLLTLVCLTIAIEVGSASNVCRVSVRKWRNVNERRTYKCGFWNRRTCSRTVTVWKSYLGYVDRCCSGYTGLPLCKIPICAGGCGNGGLCIRPGVCSCLSGTSGSNCQIQKCSYTKDCFPGTCRSNGCICSSGYEGGNCEKIRRGADFESCGAELRSRANEASGGEHRVVSGVCTEASESVNTYWSNKGDVSSATLSWRTIYTEEDDLPHRPVYIRQFTLGIIEVYATITHLNANGGILRTDTVTCPAPVSPSNPHLSAQCDNIRYTYHGTLGLAHGHRLQFNMFSKVGGFKEVRNVYSGWLQNVTLQALTSQVYQRMEVRFDFENPFHCSVVNCSTPVEMALTIGNDVTRTLTIYLDGFGWEDKDSNIVSYNFRVYQLLLDGEGFLSEVVTPVGEMNVSATHDGESKTYDLPEPWMYSVLLQVLDGAGNRAMVRTLVMADDMSHVSMTSNPLYVIEAALYNDHSWLHSYDSEITVRWSGHFENEFLHKNSLLNPVRPRNDLLIDDTTGNRTIEGVSNVRGIVRFDIASLKLRGADVPDKPQVWEKVPDVKESSSLVVDRADGDSIVVWVRATDFVGNSLYDRLIIGVDSTPPAIGLWNFKKNINSPDITMPYASGVSITSHDSHSGLSEVVFNVTAFIPPATNLVIQNGTVRVTPVAKSEDQCHLDGDCVCADVGGECFAKVQQIFMDHCLVKHHQGSRFHVMYTVYNRAGLQISDTADIGVLDNVNGVNDHPGPRNLTAASVHGNTVRITWYQLASCFTPSNILIYFTVNSIQREIPVRPDQTSYIIEGLTPENDYTVTAVVEYSDGIASQPEQLQVNSGQCVPSDHICLATTRGSGLAGGVIAAVVIVCILLILVIVIGVVVVVRIRQNKPAVPTRVHDAMRSVRKRLTMSSAPPAYDAEVPLGHRGATNDYGSANGASKEIGGNSTFNVAYVSGGMVNNGFTGDEEDIYIYGTQEDLVEQWTFSNDEVELGDVITNGSFAVIRKATVGRNANMQILAAKLLRSGASEADQLLLNAKMNFLATGISQNEFVVNLIGAVKEVPILLLEFCETNLKDWLKEISTQPMNDEVEDHMINFTSHIAKGMAHLHETGVVHRRLAARNVLLKKVKVGMVAKVTGFGPMKGEESSKDAAHKEKIPIKWMAPESMEKTPDGKRVYNEKTDVWSFGVTTWEIFAKGKSPYSSVRSADMKQTLESGELLEKPKDCSEDLFNETLQHCWDCDPSKRPSFNDIVATLGGLFHGQGGQTYYYEGVDN